MSETVATDTDDTKDSEINQLKAQISDLKKKMKSKDKQCYRLKRSLSALKDFVGIKNMKGLSKKKIMKQPTGEEIIENAQHFKERCFQNEI